MEALNPLVSSRPALTSSEAQQHLERHFGLTATLSPLPAEWDQNFLVDAGSQGTFVLKIANAAHPPGLMALQNDVMGRIAALELPTPHVIRSRTEQSITTLQHSSVSPAGAPALCSRATHSFER